MRATPSALPVAGVCDPGSPDRCRRPRLQSGRGGFTLVELLVVIGIMLVLIGLSLLVANSGLIGNYRMTGGSDRVAGWLMQAKQRAQRDGAPRGVRFIPDPANPTLIREAQLIEVPDPFTLPPTNRVMIGQWPAAGADPGRHLYIVGPDVAQVPLNVAVGDTLSLPTFGTVHRVTALSNPATTFVSVGGANVPAVEVTVADPSKIPDIGASASAAATAPPTPTFAVEKFGFVRQARPVFGEPSLVLTDGTAIAINPANTTDPTNLGGNSPLSLIPNVIGNYDVVFAPNGEILNAGGLGRVVLWVRNPDAFAGNLRCPSGAASPATDQDLRANYETAGEMTLITVYTRTGGVAIHPVTLPAGAGPFNPPTPHDPYQYTKDGIASGL